MTIFICISSSSKVHKRRIGTTGRRGNTAYMISRAIKINDRNKIRKVLMNFPVLYSHFHPLGLYVACFGGGHLLLKIKYPGDVAAPVMRGVSKRVL